MRRLVLSPIVLFLAFALGRGGGSPDIHTSPPTPPPLPSISIGPTTASVLVDQTAQLQAKVQGMSSADVTWSIEEQNGGTVTSGLYRAPWGVGTYHVTATAVADNTKTATATISISAVTAFLQELPGGKSTPRSVTPVLGILHPDGTWENTPIIDPNTNAPMDTSLYDIFLSADGTKAVGSTPLYDAQGDVAWNIVALNSDGSGMTTLTNNVPTPKTDYPTETGDRYPQLSPDGKFIVYSRWPGPGELEIWEMNADESTPQTLSSKLCPADYYQCSYTDPSFSPDGSKIVYHFFENFSICCSYFGIGSTNADGTGTANYITFCQGLNSLCGGWDPDNMPTFTNDASKIAFTHRTS